MGPTSGIGRVRTRFRQRERSHVGYIKVEISIQIVVQPKSSAGMAAITYAGFPGNVFKGSIAAISKETISSLISRYIEIDVAVIIVITKGATHRDILGHVHTSLPGDILEFEVSFIDVKSVRAEEIEQINIHEAVSVDVCHQHSRTVIILVHSIIHSLFAWEKVMLKPYSRTR